MPVSKAILSAALISSLILALAIHTARLIPNPVSAAAPPSLDPQELWDLLADSGFEMAPHPDEQALMEQRMIVVAHDINANCARQVVRKLLLLDRSAPGEPIDLFLRTEGGWEADAFAIIDVMRTLKSPVNAHAIGECHSAGVMILCSATGRRIVHEGTILGFHDPEADEEEVFLKRYQDLFRTHTLLPEAWIDARDGEMRYATAGEALKYGLADEMAASRPPKSPPTEESAR